MKEMFVTAATVLALVSVTASACLTGCIVIDWNVDLMRHLQLGWRAVAQFAAGVTGFLALLSLIVAGCLKEPVAPQVEGVHDGP